MSVYKIASTRDLELRRRAQYSALDGWGERVSGCAGCYQEEEAGGVSLRKGPKSRLARRLAQ